MDELSLQGHCFIALHNVLKLEGWCATGGAAKQVIAQGKVSVDGSVELRKSCKIKAGRTVSYDGKTIRVIE